MSTEAVQYWLILARCNGMKKLNRNYDYVSKGFKVVHLLFERTLSICEFLFHIMTSINYSLTLYICEFPPSTQSSLFTLHSSYPYNL